MAKILIKFFQDGKSWQELGKTGETLMVLANKQGEIFGYCGGQLACTTCRVYLENKYTPLLSPPTEIEEDILAEFANNKLFPERSFQKRMSCQIKLKPQLHGLSVHIPPLYI